MSSRFSNNATLPILIAIALGMVLGLFYPGVAVEMKLLSDTFIKVVGLLMPFLLFVLVSTSYAKLAASMPMSIAHYCHEITNTAMTSHFHELELQFYHHVATEVQEACMS